jgi:propanol-preferring alcohol dehydrogenase
VALDTAPDKLALAHEVSAHEAIEAGEGAGGAVRELTDGLDAEVVLDRVVADQTLTLAAEAARFESHATIVGLAGGRFEFARAPCR